MSNKDLTDIVEGTTRAILDSQPVKNITDPPTKSIGTAFGDMFDLCFGSLHEKAEKSRILHQKNIDDFKASLTSNVEKIPEENLMKPKLSVIGPALEASKYYYEEKEIRDMFEKLIVNSMDNRKASEVHPSFTEIIKQLSPLDAQNLRCFSTENQLPICEFRISQDSNSFNVIQTNLFISNPQCQNIDLQSVSMSSLNRLELISIKYDLYFSNEKRYEAFKDLPFYKQFKMAETVTKRQIEIQKGIASITPLGRAFLNICLSPLPN